jgi:LytTr DNA-binding domain-containing protein
MRWSRPPISTDLLRTRFLLAAAIWGTQFLIVSGFALTGGYPHPLAGLSRRLAMSIVGALLCIAIGWILDRTGPVSASRRFVLPVLLGLGASLAWSLFTYAVVHLVPGDGIVPPRAGIARELAQNGSAAGSLFAVWLVGCLALDYRRVLAEAGSRGFGDGSRPAAFGPAIPEPGRVAETAASPEDQSAPAPCPALWVPVRGGKERLPLDMIEYFEADHDYVRIHATSGRHHLHRTLAALHRELEPGRFLRVHRSFIVNLAEIAQLRRRPGGLLELALTSGARLPVGRTYSGSVRKRLLARDEKPS